MAKRAVSVRCGSHTVRGVKLHKYGGARGIFVSVGGRKVGSVVPVGSKKWASSRLSSGGYEEKSYYHQSATSATKSLVCRARSR